VADQPLTKRYTENGYPFSDKDDIFSYEKMRDEITPYAQRTSDIVVTEVGQEYNVNTYILMSPSIFGTSTNPLHEFAQTSGLIRASLKLGQTPVVGDGSATWDHVHIIDVARLYKLIVTKILHGVTIPKGKKGIYFIQSGHHSWLELSQRVAEAGFALGALKLTELRSLSLEESTEYLGRGSRLLAEIGWASKYVSPVRYSYILQM
jgi:nucleoside-diphosphate-sugar epimerase